MKARLRVHDQSRADHQETIKALEEALSRARSHDVDGVIIIMTSRDKADPQVVTAGKLTKADRALMNVARLGLGLVVQD